MLPAWNETRIRVACRQETTPRAFRWRSADLPISGRSGEHVTQKAEPSPPYYYSSGAVPADARQETIVTTKKKLRIAGFAFAAVIIGVAYVASGVEEGSLGVLTDHPTEDPSAVFLNRSEMQISWSWSPDGKKAARTAVNPGTPVFLVFLSDENGHGPEGLTYSGGFLKIFGWSTDSRRLYGYKTPGTIFDVGESAFDYREPFSDWNVTIGSADLSPSGDRIAFTQEAEHGSNIWAMRSDGSDLRQVTSDNTGYDPAWIDDDTLVYGTGQNGLGLYSVKWDGAGHRLLVENGLGFLYSPVVSPDGARLLVGRATPEGQSTWVVEPLVMNIDGTDIIRLSPDAVLQAVGLEVGQWATAIDAGRWIDIGVWSPDGSAVAWAAGRVTSTTGDVDIWVANADGSERRILWDDEGLAFPSDWSLGGRLAFVGFQQGSTLMHTWSVTTR